MNFTNRPVSPGALRTAPLILTLLCPLANGAEIFWANPVTGSFSDPSLWTGGVVPGATDGASIPAGTVNIAADWALTNATAGTLAASSALFNQTAGNAALTGDLRLGTVAAATGGYTLSGGKLTVANAIHVGEMGAGTLKIATDLDQTATGIANRMVVGNRALPASGNLAAEDVSAFASPSSLGSVQHTAGAFNLTNELWIGLGSGGSGTADTEGGYSDINFGMYELSGTATLRSKNWLLVGRTGGEGVLNISGGTLTKTAEGDPNCSFVAGSYDAGRTSAHGTINQTGGVVTT
ncbi:MAG: Autotransporter-associated beta strand repeat protein, partial [Akkermansiaceae bacterium]|nr:Autotransporter-associated beta strand repeat protein [Akkermansiaceae bacterium]